MMLEIIKVGDVIKMEPVPDRTELVVPRFKGGTAEERAARAARAAEMRGFKESVAKAERKEKFYDWLAVRISNGILGIIVFGMLAAALYFGNC